MIVIIRQIDTFLFFYVIKELVQQKNITNLENMKCLIQITDKLCS